MERIEFFLEIGAPKERVLLAFWDLEDWPAVARHVRQIDMHYSDPQVQVLSMHVQTRSRFDRFQSVRIRQGDSIFYFQPAPPPALAQHYGWWRFSPAAGDPSACRVISEHFLEVRLPEGARFLAEAGIEAEGEADVKAKLCEVIHNNSLETMRALKKRLEGEIEGGMSHASAA